MLSSRGLSNGEYVIPSASTPVFATVTYDAELEADDFERSVAGRLGSAGGVTAGELVSVERRGGGGGGAFFAGDPPGPASVPRRAGIGGAVEGVGAGAAGERGSGSPVMYLDEKVSSTRWTCIRLLESSSVSLMCTLL